MQPGDRVKVYRGPLSGRDVTLLEHFDEYKYWEVTTDNPLDQKLMIFDYELLETIPTPKRKLKGKKK